MENLSDIPPKRYLNKRMDSLSAFLRENFPEAAVNTCNTFQWAKENNPALDEKRRILYEESEKTMLAWIEARKSFENPGGCDTAAVQAAFSAFQKALTTYGKCIIEEHKEHEAYLSVKRTQPQPQLALDV